MSELVVSISAEVAQALKMPPHHIEIVDGCVQFRCDAPEGSVCRLECAEFCGSEEWPCYGWDPETDEPIQRAHDMIDSGECHVVLFLSESAGDPWESYEGPEPEILGEQTLPGPIEVAWRGAYYSWKYAEPTASECKARDDV